MPEVGGSNGALEAGRHEQAVWERHGIAHVRSALDGDGGSFWRLQLEKTREAKCNHEADTDW